MVHHRQPHLERFCLLFRALHQHLSRGFNRCCILIEVRNIKKNTHPTLTQNTTHHAGLTPSQIGTLSLTSPIKAAGYVLWGVLADNIGIKKALLFSIIISTLAMEPLRWRSTYTVFTWVLIGKKKSLVFHFFQISIMMKNSFCVPAKGVRTATNAAWPLVDSFAAKSGGLKGYGSIRLW